MSSCLPLPLPVLYSFRRCPYAMRARLAIAVSGRAIELREVLLRDKPAQLLAASLKATVPVLVLAGAPAAVLEESLEIMRWALQQSDPGHWLLPDAAGQADTAALIAACDGEFKRNLDGYKYPNRFAPGAPIAEHRNQAVTHRTQAAHYAALLNARLSGASPYLCGSHATLADMAIAPFIRQFAQVDSGWFHAQPWPQLQRWLRDWAALPLLARVMHKYPPWRAGDVPVIFVLGETGAPATTAAPGQ